LFAGGCAASKGESVMRADYDFSKVEKVAVVEVTGRVRGETVKNQISDFFVMELLKKGYAPVERRQVQALLKEQEFQASDITTDEGAARAGRILNVPAVLVVNVSIYKESLNMTAKMVDVEDGSILWMGTGSGTTGKTAATILGAAAGAAAGVLVAGDETDDKVIGGVIGGVLGGAAGQALSPQQAEQVKKVVKEVCKDLRYRVPAAKK
jgi:hypothetical protein